MYELRHKDLPDRAAVYLLKDGDDPTLELALVRVHELAPLRRGQAETDGRLEVGLPDADESADFHSGETPLTNPLPNSVLRTLKGLSRASRAQQFGHIQSPSIFAYVLLSTPRAGGRNYLGDSAGRDRRGEARWVVG